MRVGQGLKAICCGLLAAAAAAPMPDISLTRLEAIDLAAYIATLPK